MPTERVPPGSPAEAACPCGSGASYDACCGPFHRGADPRTAERLMRSRYAAYAVGDEAYLLRTWHSTTRPPLVELEPPQTRQWLGLEVLAATRGGAFETEGTVEFVARYELGGRPGSLHEHSRFVREDGRWRYVGEVGQTTP